MSGKWQQLATKQNNTVETTHRDVSKSKKWGGQQTKSEVE